VEGSDDVKRPRRMPATRRQMEREEA
jgi:hypothetical protein